MFDRVLAGVAPVLPAERPITGARFAVLTNVVLDALEPAVAAAYEWALSRLSAAGAVLTELPFTPFDTMGSINRYGFSPIEAWWYHRQYVQDVPEQYDVRVLLRIKGGEAATASDYLDLMQARRQIIASAQNELGSFDGILMPTAPILPPRIEDVESDQAAFFAANGKVLRNPSLINFLDGCALSLPIPGDDGGADAAPVGLMIAGLRDRDDTILSVGAAVEKTLAAHTA
jgi:aspartyl-tRNA(Asn)/glutamyl-tRNA(Gln) amidotransferase subunit A